MYNNIMLDVIIFKDKNDKKETEELGRIASVFSEKIKNTKNSLPDNFVNIIDDKETLEKIKSLQKEKISEKLKYIFVCGMGGSITGAKAVYDGLRGCLNDINTDKFPKIIFIDFLEQKFFSDLEKLVENSLQSAEEFLLVLVSKSGSTIEVLTQAEIISGYLKSVSEDYPDRIVIITGEASPLDKFSQENNISKLLIPDTVGGRYSVFSSAGLFPLACAKIDIENFLEGAREARDNALSENPRNNQALKLANFAYEAVQTGKNIHDIFFFSPRMESLGKWARALYSESLGKRENQNGEEIRNGFTTCISIAPPDLHSVLQLNLAGPLDKFTTFVTIKRISEKKIINNLGLFERSSSFYSTDTREILSAIETSIIENYKKEALTMALVKMEEISEKSLGAFMMTKMIEVVYLAEVMNINAFNQPEVEYYKEETKRILGLA